MIPTTVMPAIPAPDRMPAETEAWRRAMTYSHALSQITGRRTACVKIHGEWTTCWAGPGGVIPG